jgi:tripartite-type tricarboxylate transporter receptor subunit TctC
MKSRNSATARVGYVAGGLYAALAFTVVGAGLAADYPNRPIRLVVSSAPGGGTDITWRTIEPKMSAALGQRMVVDNRGGAGGDIGAGIVARATPDGYTVLGGVSSLTINPAFKKDMPYDVLRDLAPISLATTSPNILLAHPSVPAKTVPELIRHLKSQPQPLQFASAGVGSMPHLMMELFIHMTGVQLAHIPYAGTGQAIGFVVGGQLPLIMGNILPVLPHVKSGRLRAYAVTSATRSSAAPEIPTLAESGVAGYEAVQWFGMWVPAGTPREITTKIHAAMVQALNDPEIRQQVTRTGADAAPSATPADFGRFVRAEMKKWEGLIKSAKLQMK